MPSARRGRSTRRHSAGKVSRAKARHPSGVTTGLMEKAQPITRPIRTSSPQAGPCPSSSARTAARVPSAMAETTSGAKSTSVLLARPNSRTVWAM